jgi:His/Glu/Gln/Arg/opine family amino acid ABC transporter permease subunit
MMLDTVAPYIGFWFQGVALTVILSVACFPISIVIGLFVAFASLSPAKVMARCGTAYMNLFRGLPEMMVIFIFFYGSNIALGKIGRLIGLQMPGANPTVAVLIALSVQFGAYAAVIFRDWMLVLSRGLIEAGYAIGMSRWQVRRRIVVSLVMRSATPALGNLFLVMLKISALASLIGVQELSRTTNIISGSIRDPLLGYSIAAILYLFISAVSGFVQHRFEARIQLSR